jgi:hypothetical protein
MMETEIQKETKKIANALALELLTTLDMSEKPKTKTIDAGKPKSTWSDKAKELHKHLLDLTQNQHFVFSTMLPTTPTGSRYRRTARSA